jgi:hypothetical protein
MGRKNTTSRSGRTKEEAIEELNEVSPAKEAVKTEETPVKTEEVTEVKEEIAEVKKEVVDEKPVKATEKPASVKAVKPVTNVKLDSALRKLEAGGSPAAVYGLFQAIVREIDTADRTAAKDAIKATLDLFRKNKATLNTTALLQYSNGWQYGTDKNDAWQILSTIFIEASADMKTFKEVYSTRAGLDGISLPVQVKNNIHEFFDK